MARARIVFEKPDDAEEQAKKKKQKLRQKQKRVQMSEIRKAHLPEVRPAEFVADEAAIQAMAESDDNAAVEAAESTAGVVVQAVNSTDRRKASKKGSHPVSRAKLRKKQQREYLLREKRDVLEHESVKDIESDIRDAFSEKVTEGAEEKEAGKRKTLNGTRQSYRSKNKSKTEVAKKKSRLIHDDGNSKKDSCLLESRSGRKPKLRFTDSTEKRTEAFARNSPESSRRNSRLLNSKAVAPEIIKVQKQDYYYNNRRSKRLYETEYKTKAYRLDHGSTDGGSSHYSPGNSRNKEIQKKQVKREYASAYRNKRRGVKGHAKPGNGAANAAQYAVSEKEKEAVKSFFSEHKATILIAMFFFLILVIMLTSVGTVGTALMSGGESFLQSTYLSSDDAITSTNDTYAALEDALHNKIDRIPQDYPGYDEYRYDLDDFYYDPYVLTSYLTAVYKEYELSDVQAELQSLFDAQYTLTLTSITETRYDSDGNPYSWHVLQVTLVNNGLESVVTGRMDEDQRKAYDVYQENQGNRSYLFGGGSGGAGGAGGVPAGLDYVPTDEALLDSRFAGMITEAEKYLGYPYVWGGSTPATSFDCSGFVSWVINHSGNGWNVGRQTANGLLGCTARVTEPKAGDLIFFQGTYDTAGASHVAIVVDPEQKIMIHAGNPIQYASYDTSYWRQHFLCYGRLP